MNRIPLLLVFLILTTPCVTLAETVATPIRAIVDSRDRPDNLTVLDRRGDW